MTSSTHHHTHSTSQHSAAHAVPCVLFDSGSDINPLFRAIEKKNQLILRAAGEGIYGVDAEGRATFVNPAAERILGWNADELI